jgi:outer membrane autotransporter protein
VGYVCVDHQQFKADDFASGYKTNRSQFSVGIDAFTTSQTRAGFGMSHAETSIGQESGSGSLTETMVFDGSQAWQVLSGWHGIYR